MDYSWFPFFNIFIIQEFIPVACERGSQVLSPSHFTISFVHSHWQTNSQAFHTSLSFPSYSFFPPNWTRERRKSFIFFSRNNTMREKNNVHYSLMLTVILVCVSTLPSVYGDNPYRYYTWKITYGDIYPLGVKQQVYI